MEEDKEIEILEETEKPKKSKKRIIAYILLVLGIILLLIPFFLSPKEPKYVNVTFDSMGGTPVKDQTVIKGTTIELPTIKKEGYTFGGWYLYNKKLNKKVKVTEDMDIYAKWILSPKTDPEEIKTFVITYNSDGGSTVDKVTIECGKPLTLPTATKNKYELVGWKDKYASIVKDGDLLACEDQTLTAVWKKIIEYTCSEGYTLSGNKCIQSKDPTMKCKENELDIGDNKCLGDYKEEDKCGTKTVSYEDGSSDKAEGYYNEENHKCYYGVEANYVEDACTRRYGEGHFINNKCYVEIDDIVNECPNNYIYMTSEQVKRKTNNEKDKAGCYVISSYTAFCLDEDFSLENDKCVKKINANIVG